MASTSYGKLIADLFYALFRKSKVKFAKIGPIKTKQILETYTMAQTLVLTDVQQVTLSVVVEDAMNNPVTPSAAPVWSVSDSTLLTVTPSSDGLSATVVTTGRLGNAQVNVSVSSTLAGRLDVQVVASTATQVVVNTGTPTDRPLPA